MAGRLIALDAGPLNLAASPSPRKYREPRKHADRCRAWLAACKAAGDRIIIPEIADYEVRREWIRVGISNGLIDPAEVGRQCLRVGGDAVGGLDSIGRLEGLRADYEYFPLDAAADLARAAGLWALLRSRGLATAADKALDADALIVAQAIRAAEGRPFLVATVDVGDMNRFRSVGVDMQAAEWADIPI